MECDSNIASPKGANRSKNNLKNDYCLFAPFRDENKFGEEIQFPRVRYAHPGLCKFSPFGRSLKREQP